MKKAETGPARGPRPGAAGRKSRRRGGWVALTGTPGTGKTSASSRLPAPLRVAEVSALALQLGVGRRKERGSVEVDLPGLRRAFRPYARSHPEGVVVGHLAHFLPVSYIIVLRCHPRELARRLRRARRSAKDRAANILSET
ncbi:MAG: AAA family ATPase, partial [Thermoplasmata archaeon]